MSNNAYLCCSPFDRIYPSDEPEFEEREHYVAMCRDAVPLVWLTLFRDDDLRRDPSASDPSEIRAACPVAATAVALQHLRAAEPALERLFPTSKLGEHTALLREAIEDWGFPYVTVELDEIACMHSDQAQFASQVASLLRGLEEPAAEARVLDCIESVCCIPRGSVIPSPTGFMENRLTRKEEVLHFRALGTAYSHSVPWE